MTDPQSKTIRTILENLFTDGYELGDSEITDCSVKPKAVDLALSDISKIIDEAKPDIKEHACRFNDGDCVCDCYKAGQDQYQSNLKERLG